MLTRNRQVGRKMQAAAGVPETLADTDFRGEVKEIDSPSLASESYERDNQRGTLTRRDDLRSRHSGEFSFTQECVGDNLAGAPPWHVDMLASGMQRNSAAVFNLPYSSRSGTFLPGDLLGNNASQALANKTLLVLYADATTIIVFQLTGGSAPANAEVWTNYNRTGSFTQNGAGAPGGYVFRPIDEPDSGLPGIATYEVREGGERYPISDAQNNTSIMLRLGEPIMLRHEVKGVPKTSNDTGTILTGTRAAPAAVGVKPIRCQSIALRLINGASVHTPVMTALEVNLNNEVTLRETITDVDTSKSGHQMARIVNRDVSASIDPLYIKAADGFDWQGAMRRGDSFQFFAQGGAIDHGNGALVIIGRRVQVAPGASVSDRNGEKAIAPTLKFRGDVEDEIYIAHVFLNA